MLSLPISRLQGTGSLLKPRSGERPGPIRRLSRSASVRFALIYAVLLAISALALALFIWWETAGVLNRQTDDAIVADAHDLMERWGEPPPFGGIPALAEAINDRMAQNVDDDAIYVLVDPWNHVLAGNLAAWPDVAPVENDWLQLHLTRAGWPMARARAYSVPGGYKLLVGRDVQVRARLADMLTEALLWALLVVILLASVGALFVNRLVNDAIASISATATAIAAGDLTKRVQLSGRGDEFDQLAETVNDMLDRIARLMDGVRQVSNAIAHDLRTPIARARARLEDAAANAGSEDELRAALERATADLDHISDIFQALLRISEIEAGARRSAFAQFDVAPLLADLAELYGAVAEDAGVSLRLTAPDHLPSFGDRSLVQQAVANLLDNAIKFSPPGGSIELRGEARSRGLEIIVQDQGPGMPEAEIPRAGERFFRGEAARHTPGSGLGLALVHAVALLHGGEMRLGNTSSGMRAALWLPGHEPATKPG